MMCSQSHVLYRDTATDDLEKSTGNKIFMATAMIRPQSRWLLLISGTILITEIFNSKPGHDTLQRAAMNTTIFCD
jgi:hypothetical protein